MPPIISDKLRKAADGLTKSIIDKTRPFGSAAVTAKRLREFESRLKEGRTLERLHRVLTYLATSRDNVTISDELYMLESKDQVIKLLGDYDNASYDGEKNQQNEVMLNQLLAAGMNLSIYTRADEIELKRLEIGLRNIPGYFPTPPKVLSEMMMYVTVGENDVLLEPSAGSGHIAEELRREFPENELRVIEWNYSLREILSGLGFNVVGDDFLEYNEEVDVIVMNPPFEKGADIDHVRHAFSLARKQVVSVMSTGPFQRSDKKATEFRNWFNDLGGLHSELPKGAFMDSDRATGVSTCIISLTKDPVHVLE